MKPSVVILTFNSEATLPATLQRALLVSQDIVVLDSGSCDGTRRIAAAAGAAVFQHDFRSYGEQRNWAIDALRLRSAWHLHLDADEYLDDNLIAEIQALSEDTHHNGFLIARYLTFLGRTLRHGGMSPTWHLRLFRVGCGRCELRQYDQHFYLLSGTMARLKGSMIDDIRMSLSEWTARHNRWSDAEVAEATSKVTTPAPIQPQRTGNPIEQKRYWRSRYNHLPLLTRPFALFCYRYFICLGFLDGKEGFIFWTLQTFWFRFLIDAKIVEEEKKEALTTTSRPRGENLVASGPR